TDLSSCIPAPANWSLSSIPRALDGDHVRLILGHCDRATAQGCRDYAILMLLSRLGLRAGEVAALQLEDIDWR
ncbi:integrase, partial [Escherichia coli]